MKNKETFKEYFHRAFVLTPWTKDAKIMTRKQYVKLMKKIKK